MSEPPELPVSPLEMMARRMEELMVQTFDDHRTTHYLADVLMCIALMEIAHQLDGAPLKFAQRIGETYHRLVKEDWYT